MHFDVRAIKKLSFPTMRLVYVCLYAVNTYRINQRVANLVLFTYHAVWSVNGSISGNSL